MKRLLIPPVAVLLAASVVLGSCDGGPFETEGTAEEAPIHVTAFAIGTPISTIVIEVTAADINQRLVFNLELVDGVASGIIEIPSGEARTFTVTAYDDQHNVTHEGSATTDVNPGSNPPLKVKLKPVAGEVDVTVTFGDYAVLVTPAEDTIDGTVSSELQLAVEVFDQYGEPVLSPTVQWATTHPTLATVSDSGLVTGLADGVVTIVATYEGVAGLSELTLIGFDGGTPTPTDSLVNGDFDLGPGVGWTESSAGNFTLIVHADSLPLGITPLPSYPYVAWLGGYADAVDILSQQISVPTGDVVLGGYLRITTDESAGPWDYVRVYLDDTEIFATDDTDPAANNGWVSFEVSLGTGYHGSHLLEIRADCDATNPTNFFFDSLELIVVN